MDEEQKKPRVVETVPSVEGGVSALASANAPIIFFDLVAAPGVYNGVAHLSLLAMRFLPGPDGHIVRDNYVTAHLRMNIPALMVLREAVNRALAAAEAPPADAPLN